MRLELRYYIDLTNSGIAISQTEFDDFQGRFITGICFGVILSLFCFRFSPKLNDFSGTVYNRTTLWVFLAIPVFGFSG